MNLDTVIKKMAKLAIDNSPAILTAIGVVGTVTTAYLAGKGAYKAAQVIERDEILHGTSDEPVERFKNRFKLSWKFYIPAATVGACTVACIISANTIGTRRAAALAAAYSLSEKAFVEYREKIAEKIGEKKERAYRDEIAQDQVSRTPQKSNLVIVEGKSVLCYETFTGRYFLSDAETIRRAENEVNHMVNNNNYATLGDFYDRVGLPRNDMSEEFGWNVNKLLDIQFSPVFDENGKPCLAISYRVEPVRGYARLI